METKFKNIPEGQVFFYEGSTYCKVTDDDRSADCFMVSGFIENNKKDEINDNTLVKDSGYEINEYIQKGTHE